MDKELEKAWQRLKPKLLKKDKDTNLKQAKLWFCAGWRAREIVAEKKLSKLFKE